MAGKVAGRGAALLESPCSPREDVGRDCAAASRPYASRSTKGEPTRLPLGNATAQLRVGPRLRLLWISHFAHTSPIDFARTKYCTFAANTPKSSFLLQYDAEVDRWWCRKKLPCETSGEAAGGVPPQSGDSKGDAQQSVGYDT